MDESCMDQDQESTLDVSSSFIPQQWSINTARTESLGVSGFHCDDQPVSGRMSFVYSSYTALHSDLNDHRIAQPGALHPSGRTRSAALDDRRQTHVPTSTDVEQPLRNANRISTTDRELDLEAVGAAAFGTRPSRPPETPSDSLQQLLSLLSEMRQDPRDISSSYLLRENNAGSGNHDSRPRCWEHRYNGRSFKMMRNYHRHLAEQQGLDSAVCRLCGAKFTRTSNRDKHERVCLRRRESRVVNDGQNNRCRE